MNIFSNITGAFATADYEGMISLVIDLFPNAKAIGTLYNPGEPNSYYHIEELKKISQKKNINFIKIAVELLTKAILY